MKHADADYCPECGSSDTHAVRGHRGEIAPGEWCDYACQECGHQFAAVTPEPPDGYVGDGTKIEDFIWRPKDWVVDDPKALVKPGPQAEPLKVYTLGALRDYVKENRDGLMLAECAVHVASPQIVRLIGRLEGRARVRETYVEATAQNLTDGFLGKLMTIDEFIVGLQTRFASDGDILNVLRLFGSVKHEGVKTLSDDGVTQVVTAKTGVVLSNEVPVPNPVTLTPFRTFREVLQPASLFVLRAHGASAGTVTAGLFEADGGAWRFTAVDRVRDWLRFELPPEVAVLA